MLIVGCVVLCCVVLFVEREKESVVLPKHVYISTKGPIPLLNCLVIQLRNFLHSGILN